MTSKLKLEPSVIDSSSTHRHTQTHTQTHTHTLYLLTELLTAQQPNLLTNIHADQHVP